MVKKKLLFFIFFPLFFSKIALSGEPIAIFGDWYFFKYVNSEKKLMCYIMSIPKSRYDNFDKRGESFFTIIREQNSQNQEIYLSFGQNYNKDVLSAEIDIVRHKFPLFTIKDKAWTYNQKDDENVINKIKRTLFFNIVVNFEGNKNLLDVYSGDGFAEAIEYLLNNCY